MRIPRRAALLALGAAFIAPPACASAASLSGTIDVVLNILDVADRLISLSEKFYPYISGKNSTNKAQDGNMAAALFDKENKIEDSFLVDYTAPANSDFDFNLNRGLSPQDTGPKMLVVASALNQLSKAVAVKPPGSSETDTERDQNNLTSKERATLRAIQKLQ